jgi:hypothetical protein
MKPNGIRLLIVAHAFDTGGGYLGFWKNRNDRLSAEEVKEKTPERPCRKEEYEQRHASFSPVQEMASEF